MVGGEVLSIFLGITTLLQSVAIFIQAIVFQKVYITTANIKFFISVLLICATFCMIWKNKFYNSLKKARIILFFVVFMLYNLIIMLIYSIPQVGLSNTFKAYLYNFSLLILIFPLWYLQIFTHKVYVTEMHIYSKRFLKLLAILILVLDVFGVFQYLFNDYLINNMIVSLLIENDYIKFDHIGSQIRANSFFKSPLEFGIFNCYFATYMAHKIIANNKVSKRNNLILVLFILSVIATVSRTAMVMLFVCIVMVLILDYGKIQNRYLFLLNVMSISILLIMCLGIIYIYKSGYGQISVFLMFTQILIIFLFVCRYGRLCWKDLFQLKT